MADPRVDLKKGYVRIANKLYEAIAFAMPSRCESAILVMLIRHSYGMNSDRCEWSVRTAADKVGLSRRQSEVAWSHLVRNNMVTCYQLPRGRNPGIWGPNKNYWEWQNMPPKFDEFASRADGYAGIIKFNKILNPLDDFASHSRGHKSQKNVTQDLPKVGHKTTKSVTQNDQKCDTTYRANAVTEGISEGSKDNKKDKDNIKPPTPFDENAFQVVVVEEENEKAEQPPVRMTREQAITAARIKFRGQATRMFQDYLSLGGLPAYMANDIQSLISQPVPDSCPVKEWFTELYQAMEEAVIYTAEAWKKSRATVKAPLRVAMSRWRASAAALAKIRSG